MERTISIGIPARNEEKTIAETVNALRNQRLPAGTKAEIMVCVNASADRTAEIVREIAWQDKRVVLLETARAGKHNALNLMEKKAR